MISAFCSDVRADIAHSPTLAVARDTPVLEMPHAPSYEFTSDPDRASSMFILRRAMDESLIWINAVRFAAPWQPENPCLTRHVAGSLFSHPGGASTKRAQATNVRCGSKAGMLP